MLNLKTGKQFNVSDNGSFNVSQMTRRNVIKGGLAAIIGAGVAPSIALGATRIVSRSPLLAGAANAGVWRGMMRGIGARNAAVLGGGGGGNPYQTGDNALIAFWSPKFEDYSDFEIDYDPARSRIEDGWLVRFGDINDYPYARGDGITRAISAVNERKASVEIVYSACAEKNTFFRFGSMLGNIFSLNSNQWVRADSSYQKVSGFGIPCKCSLGYCFDATNGEIGFIANGVRTNSYGYVPTSTITSSFQCGLYAIGDGVACIRAYSRPLTAQEVADHYSLDRKHFGLQ